MWAFWYALPYADSVWAVEESGDFVVVSDVRCVASVSVFIPALVYTGSVWVYSVVG